MNYTELTTAITDTCEDSFSADDLARFVKQAEQKVYASVQLPSLRKTASLATVSGDVHVDAPTDFVAVHSLAIVTPGTGAYVFLVDKDVNFIREAYPVPATTGVPKYYALYGPATDATELKFILGPTPGAIYTAELQYYHAPTSIVTANTTWLGDNFDSALLNGALVEALRFQKAEQDVIALHQDMFRDSLALLKNLGDGKQRTDTYRAPQTRVKPL